MTIRYSALAISAIIAGLSLASASQAADWQRGEQLHNSQCVTCHAARYGNNGTEIYTRADRRIQSLEGLQRQVNLCKNNLQIIWFDEDVADVVDYLNRNFYKFEQ
jgi:cytochrome c2